MILAILIGALIHNTMGNIAGTGEGVNFSLRRILRFSIILIGLQITAQQAIEVGVGGVSVIALALVSTLAATILVGRLMGVSRGVALLIGVGTSICGASAIVAAKAATGGEDDDAAYAVAGVTLFGTIAMFLYPALAGVLHRRRPSSACGRALRCTRWRRRCSPRARAGRRPCISGRSPS